MHEKMSGRREVTTRKKGLLLPVRLGRYLHEETRKVKIAYILASITLGLLMATVLTLVLVPALYMIVKDLTSLSVTPFGQAQLFQTSSP
jgi:hypothetical protein